MLNNRMIFVIRLFFGGDCASGIPCRDCARTSCNSPFREWLFCISLMHIAGKVRRNWPTFPQHHSRRPSERGIRKGDLQERLHCGEKGCSSALPLSNQACYGQTRDCASGIPCRDCARTSCCAFPFRSPRGTDKD